MQGGDCGATDGLDVPQLHHLKDVVVLPQTGDRDVASMCSGGDLDGDDFLVIWDQDLLPSEWNVEPMDYSRPYVPEPGDQIDVDDLTTFFVTYMKNDTLASIRDQIDVDDLTTFFVTYMKNDTLASIRDQIDVDDLTTFFVTYMKNDALANI